MLGLSVLPGSFFEIDFNFAKPDWGRERESSSTKELVFNQY